ncbi:MAG TPA: thrombospondin type 3 repeat-containing protein, partial [Phycisphaerae bacterium]
SNTFPTGLNDAGQVIGYSSAAADSRLAHAFLWQDGRITDLGTLGGDESSAEDVNDSGQVVGWATLMPGFAASRHAVLWSNGQIIDLGTLGGSNSEARAINNSGQIVGWAETAEADALRASGGFPREGCLPRHAFLWENGVMTDLGTLGGPCSEAWSISDTGVVTGYAEAAGQGQDLFGNPFRHAVLWRAGELMDLGRADGFEHAEALAVNARGEVLVTAHAGGDVRQRAFVWRDGALMDLGSVPGFRYTFAAGINNLGWIAGSTSTDDSIENAGFLYRGGRMVRLDSLLPSDSGWAELSFVVGINNAGQVAGTGMLNGAVRAFLMTPSAADRDTDGVVDALDNCPSVANPDQAVSDADGT